ncbi:MAG: hypothetical protein JSW54_03455, partial [Fidelibacterota bacterium]
SSGIPFLTHVQQLAKAFREGIDDLRAKHPRFLMNLHQRGLMMGLQLKDELCGPILTKAAYDNDLLLIYANNDTSVCQLLPPLVMELAQVEYVMDRLDQALQAARKLKPLAQVKLGLDKVSSKVKGKSAKS